MKIHRTDLSDVLSGLPDVENLSIDYISSVDLFIFAEGFEERSTWVAASLVGAGALSATDLLIIRYPTNREDNKAFSSTTGDAIGQARRVSCLLYSRESYAADLRSAFDSLAPSSLVVVDISGMASYVLYPLLAHLFTIDCRLVLTYVQASSYSPTHEEWLEVHSRAQAERTLFTESFEAADFQSVGVECVYPSSVSEELNAGNMPTRLIAVPNFSPFRMNAIVARDAELNKSRSEDTIWLIGQPPGERHRWRGEAVRTTHSLGAIGENNIRSVCTLNYKEIIGCLESIWLEYRHQTYLSIGNLGSKMQHVGTFLFSVIHPEVCLWLAEPTEFRANSFSSGTGQAHQLAFEETSSLRASLESYGRFTWEW